MPTGQTHTEACALSDREAQVVRLLMAGARPSVRDRAAAIRVAQHGAESIVLGVSQARDQFEAGADPDGCVTVDPANLLRMDAATVAGLALGVLGVLVAIVTYLLSRRPKKLGFAFEQWIPLLSEAYPDIELTHRGIAISNPYFFQVRLKNYGKVEIRPEDFVKNEPLTVAFADAGIIDASVKVVRKGQVRTGTQNKGSGVEFDPVLINPGEEVILTGIASSTNSRGSAHVSGRIAGVTEIPTLTEAGRWEALGNFRVQIPYGIVVATLFFYGLARASRVLVAASLILYALYWIPLSLEWRRRRLLR